MTGDDSVADALDELYGLAPEEFTARRGELAAAAKKRGDREEAKLIAAARRPTAAAWVANVLIRADATAGPRLSELGADLRAAHASMDGVRIRELTAAQRKLVNELVRTAFAAAAVSNPTGALRDDVTGTLQAAIADPDLAARLGRLERAEQWSGFGGFAVSAAVGSATRGSAAGGSSNATVATSSPSAPEVAMQRAAARQRRDDATAELDSAQAAHAEAADAVGDRRGRVATARRRYEKLLETLSAAEHDVDAASAELDAAEQAALGVAARVQAATAELEAAEAELVEFDAP